MTKKLTVEKQKEIFMQAAKKLNIKHRHAERIWNLRPRENVLQEMTESAYREGVTRLLKKLKPYLQYYGAA